MLILCRVVEPAILRSVVRHTDHRATSTHYFSTRKITNITFFIAASNTSISPKEKMQEHDFIALKKTEVTREKN